MSLQNYSFDKDNNSLSLVTFTSPDGGRVTPISIKYSSTQKVGEFNG